MIFFMLTSVKEESSQVLCAGEGAEELLSTAFGCRKEGESFVLPGVVSRKKQLIPAMLNTLQQM